MKFDAYALIFDSLEILIGLEILDSFELPEIFGKSRNSQNS